MGTFHFVPHWLRKNRKDRGRFSERQGTVLERQGTVLCLLSRNETSEIIVQLKRQRTVPCLSRTVPSLCLQYIPQYPEDNQRSNICIQYDIYGSAAAGCFRLSDLPEYQIQKDRGCDKEKWV